jgi:hypothetical protein
MQRKLLLPLYALVLALVACWIWQLCARNTQAPFLPRRSPADWIVYPKPPELLLQRVAELPAMFRRSFTLPQTPGNATLSIRACRRFIVTINGHSLPEPKASANWKDTTTIDVGQFLKTGSNIVSVTVFNHLGPPALWFR